MKAGFTAAVTSVSNATTTRSTDALKQQQGSKSLEKTGVFFKLLSKASAEGQHSFGIHQGELEKALGILQDMLVDELTPEELEIINEAIQLLTMQLNQLKTHLQGAGQSLSAKPVKEEEVQIKLLAVLEKTLQQLEQVGAAAAESVEKDAGMLQMKATTDREGIFKQLTEFVQQLTAEQRNYQQRPRGTNDTLSPMPVTDSETQESLPEQELAVAKERPEPLMRESRQPETVRSAESSQPATGIPAEVMKSGTAPQRTAQPTAPVPVMRAAYLADDLAPVLQSSILLTGTGESSQLKVNISPEHLGHLDIRLLSSDGKIAAQIFTSSLAAKEVLDFQMNQLRNSLLQQGIAIESIDVSYEEPHSFTGEQNQHSDQRFFRQQKSATVLQRQQGYEQSESEPVRPAFPTDGLMKVDYTI